MSSPFESQVWEFISRYRPLKLVFLVVAAVGITKSAFDAVTPLAASVHESVVRLMSLQPPAELRERYGCAIAVPKYRPSKPTLSKLREPENLEHAQRQFAWANLQIAKCQSLLGLSTGVAVARPPSGAKATELDIDALSLQLDHSLAVFAGHLYRADYQAYRLYVFSDNLQSTVEHYRAQEAANKDFLGRRPDTNDVDYIDLGRSYELLRDVYIYRLPIFKPNNQNNAEYLDWLEVMRQELRQAINAPPTV